MKPNKHNRRAERGTQVVELAIVLPLMALLAMIVAEGSALLRAHQVLSNAAREGARLAALPENYELAGGVQNAVVQYAVQNGVPIQASDVTVNQQKLLATGSGVAMRSSQVTVTYPYPLQYLPLMPFSTVPPTVTLAGSAEFRNLY